MLRLMAGRRETALALIIMATSIPAVWARQGNTQEKKTPIAVFREAAMRSEVTEAWMPVYPNEALKAGAEGTAMAAILFDEDGNVSKVAILESPHPAITEALTGFLKQWKTSPRGIAGYPRIRVAGWLSFDFKIKQGVGHVGYSRRTADDNRVDKRYVHPFTEDRYPFYYGYEGVRFPIAELAAVRWDAVTRRGRPSGRFFASHLPALDGPPPDCSLA